MAAPLSAGINDYDAQREDIARRQKYAELLQQQATDFTPQPTQMVGGWAIPQGRGGALQALAQVLKGYTASNMLEKTKQEQTDLSAQRSAALAQAMQAMPQSRDVTTTQPTDQQGTGSFDMSGTPGPATQTQRVNPTLQENMGWLGSLASLGKDAQTMGTLGLNLSQKHEENALTRASQQELARSRLTQQLQLADMNHQMQMAKLTRPDDKLAETVRHNHMVEAIQRDATANAGGRLAYDTGLQGANSAATLAAQASAPAPQQAASLPPDSPMMPADQLPPTNNPALPGNMVRGTAPDEQAAMRAALAAVMQGKPATINVGTRGPQPVQVAGPAQPVQQTAPSAPVVPFGDGLDARDLQVRAAQGAAPAPVGVPPVPTTAQNAPPMPQSPEMPLPAAAPAPQVLRRPDGTPLPNKAQDAAIVAASKQPPAGSGDAVAQAIVEGRMALPSGFALRSPYWQGILEKVTAIDPKFDATRYGARQAAARTFASGPEAKNVTALNTVIGHLGTLDEMATALGNNDLRAFNSVANRFSLETGDPKVVNFETAKNAVADETMRVFRQVGASDAEAKRWGETLNSSNSPAQLRGNIATLGKLLDSRVTAISQQYERTVNSQGNPARVDPGNRARLDQLISQGGATATPPVNAKGWALHKDAKGNEAYVSPDGKQFEEVR